MLQAVRGHVHQHDDEEHARGHAAGRHDGQQRPELHRCSTSMLDQQIERQEEVAELARRWLGRRTTTPLWMTPARPARRGARSTQKAGARLRRPAGNRSRVKSKHSMHQGRAQAAGAACPKGHSRIRCALRKARRTRRPASDRHSGQVHAGPGGAGKRLGKARNQGRPMASASHNLFGIKATALAGLARQSKRADHRIYQWRAAAR